MKLQRIFVFFLIFLFGLVVAGCDKKDSTAGMVEEPAIVGIIEVVVSSIPGGTDVVAKLNDGAAVVCLNRAKPEAAEGGDTDAPKYYKVRLPENSLTGWVPEGSLAFKDDDVKDAFVTGAPWLYTKLNYGTVQLHWGDTVKYLGYKIYHDWPKYGWDGMELWRVDVEGVEGWILSNSLLLDVFPGIVLEDADLFKLPTDRSQNIDGSVKKMDIVPVIDKGTDGWVTVRPVGAVKDYFLSAAKGVPVSYKDVDFTLVSYMKDAYYNAKAIDEELDIAFDTGDPNAAILAISDKAGKIKTLKQAKQDIENKIDDCLSSTFAPEMKQLLKEIDEMIIILEDAKDKESAGGAEDMAEAENEVAPIDSAEDEAM